MARFAEGLRVQIVVVKALMIRELVTRFGRENIGFLWVMAEPLLFAGLVGLVWTYSRGPEYHGIGIVAFVVTGYIPLTFLRHSFSRAAKIFQANMSLLYHRQVKVLDFIFVRVAIEAIGAMMAFLFAAVVLIFFGQFPIPADVGALVAGWGIYCLIILAICTMLAPLSEISSVVEKLVPVSVYVSIPFSGVFNMASWVPGNLREMLMWSPLVSGMELMRYGVFGDAVTPYYDVPKALGVSIVFLVFGLILCRHVRKDLAVS